MCRELSALALFSTRRCSVMSEPQCDFCDSREIAWRYRAKSFALATTLTFKGITHTFPWGSEGDWAACDTCSNYIEAEDWDGLADRSYKTNPLAALFEAEEISDFRDALLRLFKEFQSHRIGDRMKSWSMPCQS